jgi:3-oxoacyl-[acyl-carrier protein] reductase
MIVTKRRLNRMTIDALHPLPPLHDQVAIVTGGSRGIGRAICLALAQSGAHIVVNYLHSQMAAEQVAEQCRQFGVQAYAFQADVTHAPEVKQLVQFACLYLGKPSILVNNAGISSTRLLLETSEEEWDAIMQTNLKAAFLCCKEVIPHMLQKRYGRIINISSIWGIAGGSCEVAYSASKGGLIAFSKALAKELGPSGITVNAVAPGVIETDMLAHLRQEEREALASETAVGRLGTPADIASVVRFLADPSSSFLTGQVISPNGGFLT